MPCSPGIVASSFSYSLPLVADDTVGASSCALGTTLMHARMGGQEVWLAFSPAFFLGEVPVDPKQDIALLRLTAAAARKP